MQIIIYKATNRKVIEGPLGRSFSSPCANKESIRQYKSQLIYRYILLYDYDTNYYTKEYISMAILKTANTKGKYYEDHSKDDVIQYVLNPDKTRNYYGSYGVNMNAPAESMNIVSAHFGKSQGVQLRHFIILACYHKIWRINFILRSCCRSRFWIFSVWRAGIQALLAL